MSSAVEIARRKIAELKRQIIDLERFIATHDALLAEHVVPQHGASDAVLHPNPVEIRGNEAIEAPVDKSLEKPTRPVRPDAVAGHMERIIRETGRPMTRGEIVRAFEARDIHIPYEDKARYLGTIAWRHKGTFINIKDRGYWLRGEPIPPFSKDRELWDRLGSNRGDDDGDVFD